jgi:hypothetical protein
MPGPESVTVTVTSVGVATTSTSTHPSGSWPPATASTALSTRLPTTVATSFDSSSSSTGSAQLVGHPQPDAALDREAGLGDEQGGHRGIGDVGRDVLRQLGVTAADAVDVADDLVVLADLDEAGDGVEAVAELVGLRPQHLRHVGHRVELALQAEQLGAVAQRRDPADQPVPRADRHAVEHQDAVADRHRHVGPRPLLRQQRRELGRQAEGGDVPPDDVVGEVEQRPGDVVGQGHRASEVDRDHPLADAVQGGVAVLDEAGDLQRFEPEGLPLDATATSSEPATPSPLATPPG